MYLDPVKRRYLLTLLELGGSWIFAITAIATSEWVIVQFGPSLLYTEFALKLCCYSGGETIPPHEFWFFTFNSVVMFMAICIQGTYILYLLVSIPGLAITVLVWLVFLLSLMLELQVIMSDQMDVWMTIEITIEDQYSAKKYFPLCCDTQDPWYYSLNAGFLITATVIQGLYLTFLFTWSVFEWRSARNKSIFIIWSNGLFCLVSLLFLIFVLVCWPLAAFSDFNLGASEYQTTYLGYSYGFALVGGIFTGSALILTSVYNIQASLLSKSRINNVSTEKPDDKCTDY